MSRIYGGIHFQFSNHEGKRIGARVAEYVCNNFLLPNRGLPRARVEAVETSGSWISVHGHLGRDCVLEASANLRDWTALATNVAVAGGFTVPDPARPAIRFYRVLER